jgi:hypothetical protein
MIKFNDFIKQNTGKKLDYDGVYQNQCVDLMNYYMQDVIGITRPNAKYSGGSAYEIFKNAKTDDNFIKIESENDTQVPQKGDIIFWNTKIGQWGHVAIFIDGNINRFTSFDQNWGTALSPCQPTEHSYLGVCGWLRPKRPLMDDLIIEQPKVTVEEKKIVKTDSVASKEQTKPVFDMGVIDGNKTKIITGLSVVVAILASQGYIDQKMVETINLITTALIGYTLRDAIKKK